MSRARVRCLPKVPQPTYFQKAPIGLPLDFYNEKWLATLPVTQQRITADSSSVAFLPDPTKSLWPPRNKNHDEREKWSDRKFNGAFLEGTIKKYCFNVMEVNSDGEEKCGAETDEEEIEGGVIDLEVPSPKEKDRDEYVGDGEWLNVYDEEEDADFEPDEEEEEEEEDEDEEEEGSDEEMEGVEEA
ncbi:hypothetical protein O181_002290 [Austropuccinia psidii MF-1]|uniref:Uncharacterized protein n=1 Tax=Austropuccinia psidii MF-1 TaxID=1389203 RepID=A0A9Q3BC57_9BASI|nr:hypothetical protein [Austropuccinia psidii MF-1]